MIKKVYSIYDSKSGVYTPPFLDFTNASAMRGFQQIVNNKETTVAQNPEDYTLFELGSFDDQKAKYELLATPHSLIMASELVAK